MEKAHRWVFRTSEAAGVLSVLVIVSLLLVSQIGCSDPDGSDNAAPDPSLGPVPVLWNFGVDFNSVFTLENVDKEAYKFFGFGYEVSDGMGEFKSLPHFTYSLDREIEIISPMEGIVHDLRLEEELTQDYVLWLKPLGDPTLWLVELDHITNVTVSIGDRVAVGDVLGNPGGGGTLGQIEFMVNGPDAHFCPFQIFDPSVVSSMQNLLATFMAEWDAAKWALPEDNELHPDHASGRFTPYENIDMVVPGCRSMTIAFPTSPR